MVRINLVHTSISCFLLYKGRETVKEELNSAEIHARSGNDMLLDCVAVTVLELDVAP